MVWAIIEVGMRRLYIGVFLLRLVEASAFADNGSLPIGQTAAARALGGTGIAAFTSVVDGEYKNPATLTKLPGVNGQAELALGFFSVAAEAQQKVSNPVLQSDDTGVHKSSAARIASPTAIGAAYRVAPDLVLAVGASAFGSKLDYGEHLGLSGLKRTTTQVNFMLGAGYQLLPELSIGATLIGQTFDNKTSLLYSKAQFARTQWHSSGKAGSAALGALFTVTPVLAVGLSYMLPKTARMKGFMDADTYNADLTPSKTVNRNDLKVSDPKEIGVGTALQPTADLRVMLDFKRILWADAPFYQDLGWRDQNVYALGAAYATGPHSWKVGFNYAKMPMPRHVSGEDGLEPVYLQGHVLSKLNIAILNTLVSPAASEKSFTLGSSHAVTDKVTVNTALVYNPPSTITRSGDLLEPTGVVGSYSYAAKLSLTTVTIDATVAL